MNLLKTMTGNNVEKQYCYEAVKPGGEKPFYVTAKCAHM